MKIDTKSFLKNYRHSVIREKLVNYHFFYEVKLAGARNDKDIQISFPEIDKEGYDIVLDDGELIKVFQLKTMLTGVKTPSWRIQKQLLRPTQNNLELLGFDNRPQNLGYEGGVILIEIEAGQQTITNFRYYYCDIYTLKAMECGLISAKKKNRYKSAARVIEALKSDGSFNRYEKIAIPYNVFLKVTNVDALLALANLSSIKEDYRFWFLHFKSYLQKSKPPENEKRIANLLSNLLVV